MEFLKGFLRDVFHPDYMWNLVALAIAIVTSHYLRTGWMGDMIFMCPLSIGIYFYRQIFCVKGFGSSWKWKWICNRCLLKSLDRWLRALQLVSINAVSIVAANTFK